MAKIPKKQGHPENGRFMRMEDMFMFGEFAHTGMTVEDVLDKKPSYIRQLAEDGTCDFDDMVFEELERRGA